jgi:predicted nucleic acid-binding protein
MSAIVLDSGILIARLLPDEPFGAKAQAFWGFDEEVEFHAPRLFRSEISAVLRKAVYTNRITNDEGFTLLQQAFRSSVTLHEDDELLLEAFHIANMLSQPRTYDAQYLALAKRLDCTFWTLDETLYNSIHRQFKQIEWLGNFKD